MTLNFFVFLITIIKEFENTWNVNHARWKYNNTSKHIWHAVTSNLLLCWWKRWKIEEQIGTKNVVFHTQIILTNAIYQDTRKNKVENVEHWTTTKQNVVRKIRKFIRTTRIYYFVLNCVIFFQNKLSIWLDISLCTTIYTWHQLTIFTTPSPIFKVDVCGKIKL